MLSAGPIILDQVGDDPDVSMPRRWKEDCKSYRHRLEVSSKKGSSAEKNSRASSAFCSAPRGAHDARPFRIACRTSLSPRPPPPQVLVG